MVKIDLRVEVLEDASRKRPGKPDFEKQNAESEYARATMVERNFEVVDKIFNVLFRGIEWERDKCLQWQRIVVFAVDCWHEPNSPAAPFLSHQL